MSTPNPTTHPRHSDFSVELVDRLAATLNNTGVRYCHWKSNFPLAEAMAAAKDADPLMDDYDLLVHRSDLSQAFTILQNLGFKPAVIKRGPKIAGIYHFYGLEAQTGQLVHVHLFNSVLTGESFVKSHLFPLETMLLENTDHIGQIKVVSKPAELLLFVCRVFIKYGSLLDLIYLAKSNTNTAELHWLQDGGDTAATLQLLKRYCPTMSESLFLKCIEAIDQQHSLIERLILARRVRWKLRSYARHSATRRITTYAHLLWGETCRRMSGKKKNKLFHSGGSVIAFIGPEATGKSTLVADSARWLGDIVAVRNVHAGKPPSSWLTWPLNALLPLIRSLLPRLRTNHLAADRDAIAGESAFKANPDGLKGLIYAVRAVALAWDRRNLLLRARRAAANGDIVICDRYPSETVGAMDSRRLQPTPAGGGPIVFLYNKLARLEERLYQQIPPPDIALQLNVSVEIAKKRNRQRIKQGKETDVYLEFRHRHSGDWQMAGVRCRYDINTEGSLEDTILNARKRIWEAL